VETRSRKKRALYEESNCLKKIGPYLGGRRRVLATTTTTLPGKRHVIECVERGEGGGEKKKRCGQKKAVQRHIGGTYESVQEGGTK